MILCNRLELGREKWDAFVDLCDEAWLWHRYDLQDAMITWPGKHDLSFAILDEDAGGCVIAVMPLHLIKSRVLRFFPWRILDSCGGPACANDLGEKHKSKVLNFIVDNLKSIARQHSVVEINIALSLMSPKYRGEHCPRVNPLLELECSNTLTQTWVVDLRKGKEEVWENMETRARTSIRKAEKEEVKIRPASGLKDLDAYYNLHCQTYSRTGVRPHPKAYFEAIWRSFLEYGLSIIFFVEHKGEVVAAENFGIFKKAAVYWTGAASKKGLSLQANSLIQWIAMQQMILDGIQWYETGEAFPGAYGGKVKGLNDFKRSFGGKLYPFYRGRIVMRQLLHSLMYVNQGLRG